MLGASDILQMNHAVKKGCVLLTHNRVDFEQLFINLINEGKNHPGVIFAARRNVYELSKRISRVLSGYTKESIKNQLMYL